MSDDYFSQAVATLAARVSEHSKKLKEIDEQISVCVSETLSANEAKATAANEQMGKLEKARDRYKQLYQVVPLLVYQCG